MKRLRPGILMAAAAACAGPAAPRYDSSPLLRSGEVRFAICGDTQRAIEPWRSSTDDEREAVVRKLLELRPEFVLIPGDLTHSGGSLDAWLDFDRLAAPLRESGIRIVPALGNHEYWGRDRPALRMFFDRFPDLQGRARYRYDAGPLRLLILNSNFEKLTAAERREQRGWLEEELAEAEIDPAVRFLLLVAHHPPYTNGPLGPSLEGRADFVDPSKPFSKFRGMVSGHVHAYERFEIDGRAFLVSGGGGGALRRVETDPARWRLEPAFRGPARRGHHVIEAVVSREGVRCVVHELGPAGWNVLDRFEIR